MELAPSLPQVRIRGAPTRSLPLPRLSSVLCSPPCAHRLVQAGSSRKQSVTEGEVASGVQRQIHFAARRPALAGDDEFAASTATPPESWAQGQFLPDGHTVSVSDMYFVAHFVRRVDTIRGVASSMEAAGVVTTEGVHVGADVLVKCIGFEFNTANEQLLGRTHMSPDGLVDVRGLWAIFEAQPDGNFGSVRLPLGSYLDVASFKTCLLYTSPSPRD